MANSSHCKSRELGRLQVHLLCFGQKLGRGCGDTRLAILDRQKRIATNYAGRHVVNILISIYSNSLKCGSGYEKAYK
jgi:hypothetical protein